MDFLTIMSATLNYLVLEQYHDIQGKGIKGKRSFGIFFFFFSKARKYGEEIKIKKK